MTGRRIVCTVASNSCHDSGHLDGVGVSGPDGGQLSITVADVLSIMRKSGGFFYTHLTTGMAQVQRWDCPTCGADTLRSVPDQVMDDDLALLPSCLG